MRQTFLFYIKILLISLSVSLTVTFIHGSFSLLAFINTLFLLSLVLLIVGGFLFVYEGGFFNGFINSYRRLYRLSKLGKYLSQFELEQMEPFAPKKVAITFPFLAIGLILFLFTLSVAYLL